MKTKLVPLLVICFALLISYNAFAQYKGGSYDGYGVDTSAEDSSLPVELSSFTASISGESVVLKWRTQTEVNNLGFTVYRSERKDGKFVKINSKLIKGQGTTATPHDYSFTDETAKLGQTYYYYIEDTDYSGEVNKSNILKVTVGQEKKVELLPKETRLLPNFPNPFNPETWIPYELSKDAEVLIRIYSVNGELIRQLDLGMQKAGSYVTKKNAVYWDGKDKFGEPVSSGLYFYILKAYTFQAIRRMVILK